MQIAKAIGYSRETIRNDFKKKIGLEGYKNIIEIINASRNMSSKLKNLSMHEAIEVVSQDNGDWWKIILKKIFEHISKYLKNEYNVNICANRVEFVAGKHTGILRVLEVKNGSHDSKTNYCRFKITEGISKYDFAIFVTIFNEEFNYYVFDVDEIKNIKSLTLRYRDVQKNRRYLSSLNNWALISLKRKA